MQTFIHTETQNTSFIILKCNFELDIYIEEQLKITCSRVWCNFALFMDLSKHGCVNIFMFVYIM